MRGTETEKGGGKVRVKRDITEIYRWELNAGNFTLIIRLMTYLIIYGSRHDATDWIQSVVNLLFSGYIP